MFSHTARGEDDDGDEVMGIGLPFKGGKEAKTESKQPLYSLKDEDDDADMKVPAPPAKKPAAIKESNTLELMRRVAMNSARTPLVAKGSASGAAGAAGETKTLQMAPPAATATYTGVDLKLVAAAGESAVDSAILFVIDATGTTDETKAQLQLVEGLIGGQSLNAVVINRGNQDLHVIGFNTDLVCPRCQMPTERETAIRAQHGFKGEGVHRSRCSVCARCKEAYVSDWVHASAKKELHTDAKQHSKLILEAIGMCVLAPLARRHPCDMDTSWAACMGLLQDLNCMIPSGSLSTFRRVQKVVVFCSRDPIARARQLILTMPLRTDGAVEFVPVIPVSVLANKQQQQQQQGQQDEEPEQRPFAPHNGCVVSVEVGAVSDSLVEIRERIETTRPVCLHIAASQYQTRWFRAQPFAPILLPPWFAAITFAADKDKPPAVSSCRNPRVLDDFKRRYQHNAEFDEDDNEINYNCLRVVRLAARVAAGSALDDDNSSRRASSKTGTAKSSEVTKEGDGRGGKRRRVI